MNGLTCGLSFAFGRQACFFFAFEYNGNMVNHTT